MLVASRSQCNCCRTRHHIYIQDRKNVATFVSLQPFNSGREFSLADCLLCFISQNWDTAGWSNAPSWLVRLLTYQKMSQPWAQATSGFENHKHIHSPCFLQSLTLGIHTLYSFGSAQNFSWRSSQFVFCTYSSFCQGYFSAVSHHITSFLFIYISQLRVKVFYLFRYPKNY